MAQPQVHPGSPIRRAVALCLPLGASLLLASLPPLAAQSEARAVETQTAEGVAAAQAAVAAGWDTTGAPDENVPRSQHGRRVDPNVISPRQSSPHTFSYYKVIGNVFQPRESTSTYAYTNNGCLYQNGGTTFRFQAPLLLPEDSIINYVRIYYLDTAATDMDVWLSRYEPGQANLDLTHVKSTGSGGYGTVLGPLMSFDGNDVVVDQATYAYVLTWGTSVATSANQICGIRVAYYPPPDGHYHKLDTPCRLFDTRQAGCANDRSAARQRKPSIPRSRRLRRRFGRRADRCDLG